MVDDHDPELSSAIRGLATRHRAPQALQDRVMAVLSEAAPRQSDPVSKKLWRPWQQWAMVGASFACGLIVSWTLMSQSPDRVQVQSLSDQVVAGHVRSLLVDHLTDVASTDQHTVKPWFSGRIDFSPSVKDLAQEGFPLVGGRLDYLDRRSVAALVYKRRLHTINLFVWPSDSPSTSESTLSSQRGFNIVNWCYGGMQYWAVSDLNAGELRLFTQYLREDPYKPGKQL